MDLRDAGQARVREELAASTRAVTEHRKALEVAEIANAETLMMESGDADHRDRVNGNGGPRVEPLDMAAFARGLRS